MKYTCLLIILFFCNGLLKAQESVITNNNFFATSNIYYNRSIQQNKLDQKDAVVKLDSIIEFSFNENEDNWDQPTAKTQFSYQESGLIDKCIRSIWNNIKFEWEKMQKLSYQYYSNNEYEVINKAYWSEENWTESEKVELNYNGKGLLEKSLFLKLDNVTGRWQTFEKWQFSYNNNGSPLRDSLYVWHADRQIWDLTEKQEYLYEANHIHYIYGSIINEKSGNWELHMKTWYLYDNNWWRLYGIYNYIYNQGEWEMSSREGEHYDESGNVNGYTSVNLQSENIEVTREVCTFDYDLTYEDVLLPEHGFIEEKYKHHLLQKKEFYTFNKNTNEEEKYKELVFYYSFTEEPTAIDRIKSENYIEVFPNPARDFVKFSPLDSNKDNKLIIYNLNGEVRLQVNLYNGVWVNIQGLVSGVYIYRIVNNQQSYTGKLIVR